MRHILRISKNTRSKGIVSICSIGLRSGVSYGSKGYASALD